jgi:hypothetical protein
MTLVSFKNISSRISPGLRDVLIQGPNTLEDENVRIHQVSTTVSVIQYIQYMPVEYVQCTQLFYQLVS